ncbi:19010_t:CDS:1, partial [Funneliformis geosporum]
MGNSASTGDVILDIGRKVGSVALAVSYFTPAAIVTIPATAVVGTVGLTTEIVGRAIDNETTREVGGFFRGLAFDAAIDG